MTQNTFTFDVNIERLNPFTGQLLYVDRMTSDYAQAHPFDVDGYLESVYLKWAECETVQFRETREALRKVWNAVLGDMNPRGDASLYPNAQEPHPALMEVWHKAGDYWRRGLRINDALPAEVPLYKITRLDDGSWISLSDKDKHLLKQHCEIREEVKEVEVADQTTPTPSSLFEDGKTEPIEAIAEAEPMAMAPDPKPKHRERKEKKTSKLQSQTSNPRQLDLFAPAVVSESNDNDSQRDMWMKIGAGVATAAVALILINTIGLFGIAAIGLIAGGLVR